MFGVRFEVLGISDDALSCEARTPISCGLQAVVVEDSHNIQNKSLLPGACVARHEGISNDLQLHSR